VADVAHDASNPVSPKPGGIPLKQASRPDLPDRGKLRVFISYSRDDLVFANQLNAALDACGFECLIDRHDISGGEDWKRRLGNLISDADTVVFVVSPSSARSEICAWEVEEAARLNKRILPVICRPLEGVSPPPRLRVLNYIYFYEEPKASDSGFGTGLASLVVSLNTDFDWLREHTHYLQRAIEWDAGGRPANRLLSGNDIAEAKAWAARQPKGAPEPTALQLGFIHASEQEADAQLSAQRKQLEAMAAAQAERETALHEAEEALKQAADAQQKRARSKNIALMAVSILAVVAGLLGLLANQHRITAVQERAAAEHQRTIAEEQRKQGDEIVSLATQIVAKLLEETKREGKPGKETAQMIHSAAWYALLAREFTKALTVADRAHALFPDDLALESNRAHALMFLERREESKALYLAHKGEPLSGQDNKLWERVIVEDFAKFRKAGLTHPMMTDIEQEMGVSR
jgi:TIR domain